MTGEGQGGKGLRKGVAERERDQTVGQCHQ